MEDNLMRRILCDISVVNGKMHDGIIPPSPEEMREKMRDPDNLLEFLAMFGKVIGAVTCCSNGLIGCFKCKQVDTSSNCIRRQIKEIAQKHNPTPKKYRIVKTTSDERCVKHTCTLPGEFEQKQAEDIVKAYNSKEYKIEAV